MEATLGKADEEAEDEMKTWHGWLSQMVESPAEGRAEGAESYESYDDDEQMRAQIVHSIQRERGVTCGYVASRGGPFDHLLATQRARSNELVMASERREQLAAIRQEADAFVASPNLSPAEVARAFHTIFSRFNALLKSMIEEPAAEAVRNAAEQASQVADDAKPRAALARALSLVFESFQWLKEATGVERAFLCGVLALPAEALAHLPSRAFAELVIGLQQQQFHTRTLIQTSPPRLLQLIQSGCEYSPELLRIQSRLLSDFDVSALRLCLSATHCWQLFTEHIDKLDQLQTVLYR